MTVKLQPAPINEMHRDRRGFFTHAWARWFQVVRDLLDSAVQKSRFFGYNESGGLTVGTSGTDLTVSTEVKKDSAFTHSSGSAEVTVNEDDDYQIKAECGFSLAEDTYVEMAIYRDSGSGYVEVSGAKAYCGL